MFNTQNVTKGVLSEGLILTLNVRASLLSGCLKIMMTQTQQSRARMIQGTMTPACPASSSVRQLARITHSIVMRTAAGTEGEKVARNSANNCMFVLFAYIRSVFSLLAGILTNDSSGGVDNGPGDLCWGLSAWAEEQLGGEGLSERPLLHLHAVFVTAVPPAYGHLLPSHQLHQLLRLAGRTQGAWLVPVEGGRCVRVSRKKRKTDIN